MTIMSKVCIPTEPSIKRLAGVRVSHIRKTATPTLDAGLCFYAIMYLWGRVEMIDSEEIRCEHCGDLCEDEDVLEVFHRACRLKATFPGCYETRGPLLMFDPRKISAQLKKKR